MPPADPSHFQSSLASSLLERVRSNDASAWERMTRLYTPLVYSWVRRAGVPQSDAADVVQDVFLEVSRSILRFRRAEVGDSFSGWIRTITRHRALDFLRRQHDPHPTGGSSARIRLELIPDTTPSATTPTDPTPEPNDTTSVLVRRGLELIRDEFETRTWQAFEATAIRNHTAAEVAATLNMSIGAVYVAKSRIIKRLREELEDLI